MNKYEWNDKLSLVDEKYVEESNPLDDKVRAKGNSSSEKKSKSSDEKKKS